MKKGDKMYKYVLDKLVREDTFSEDLDAIKKYHDNACEVHHLLAELFNIRNGEVDYRQKNNILYRESLRREGTSFVYSLVVQSDIPISETETKKYGFEIVSENKEIENDLKEDALYKVFLRVSPYQKADNKKVFIREKKDREGWVKNKLSHCGECEIIMLNETDMYKTSMQKEKQEGFIINGREYNALVKLKDKDAFAQIMNKGIGPCKCYGYGLVEVEEVC